MGCGVMGEDGEFLLEGPEPGAAAGHGYRHVAGWYRCIGISKRTFFRWRSVGEAAGELPPFDEPEGLEAWYGRMADAGHYKNGFPKGVREAIQRYRGGAVQVSEVVEKKSRIGNAQNESAGAGAVAARGVGVEPRPQAVVPRFFGMDHGEQRGLAYEIDRQESLVAALRCARDEAYEQGRKDDGDVYARQYGDALDALSLVKQRALKILETEKKLVSREDVEADLAPRITGVVIGGMFLYGRLREQLELAQDEEERQAIWKRGWMEHCQTLMQSQYLPAGIAAAPDEVWDKAADVVRGYVPEALTLEAA